jgi:hypothetical protein
MTETEQRAKSFPRVGKVLSAIALTVLCILLLVAAAIKIYLSSSLPPEQLSRQVTSFLHQPFIVKSIETSGGTIILKGVRLQNPPGFPGDMASADSVAIAPEWRTLLHGGQRFRLISLDGIRVNLEKNRKGVWNFSHLQEVLGARKPSKAETFIKELVVKNGSISVQGEGLQGISLRVLNLTTKGSVNSDIDLSFEDPARNRYLVTGKARPGSDAAVDLKLTAPAISLKDAAKLLKVKNLVPFERGKGALQVNVALHKGDITAAGAFSFAGINLPAAKPYPLAGNLVFTADYNTKADTVHLRHSTLTLNRLARVQASGVASHLRRQRDFFLDAQVDDVDLATASVLLPEKARREVIVGGKLRCDSLHLAGDRSGLKTANGLLELHDGSISRKGRLIVAGVTANVELKREGAGIVARGRASAPGEEGRAMVRSLDLPFSVAMSRELRPVAAAVPAFSGVVMEIPLRGTLTFDAAKANPVTATVTVPELAMSKLNPLLKRYDVQGTAGSIAVTADIAGKNGKDFNAAARIQLADLRGSRGKDVFQARRGVIDGKMQSRGGKVEAHGSADLAGLGVGGKNADARFGFRVADGIVYLDDLRASAAGSNIAISHLHGRIPVKQVAGTVTLYPVHLDFDGGSVRHGKVEMSGLSGNLRGSVDSDGTARWLEGTANFQSNLVKLEGKRVGSPLINASFSKKGATAVITGEVIGGKISGTTTFDPFAPGSGASFDAVLTGADLKGAAAFLPQSAGIRPSGGSADLSAKGSYSGSGGLNCRFQTKGSGIALIDAKGKTMASGAALSLAGEMKGGDVVVSDGVISPGPDINLRVKGEVAQALTLKRKGALTFSLPKTPLNSIVDPFVNLLPRFIQEANIDGTVALDGRLTLQDGKDLLEGGLVVNGGKMEVPSQKLLMADLNGRLPFSIDLSGKERGRPEPTISFSRDNYPRLLQEFRNARRGGEVITVGKIAFGGLQMGKLTMYVSAGNGVTDITSLNTTMFEGSILGRGFIMMRSKVIYRTDLLVNNVSLKALCAMFPNIQGYISGRVDGVLSLRGRGTGMAAIAGFTDLWAREGGGEKMVVSKEFLQRMAKQKLGGFFFRTDRPYDRAEIKALLQDGDLTFDTLAIEHTNFFGVRDLSVSIAPSQNRISLEHLLDSIREASVRGAPATGAKPEEAPAGEAPAGESPAPPQEFKWGD